MLEQEGTTHGAESETETPPAGSQGSEEGGQTTGVPGSKQTTTDEGSEEEAVSIKGFTKRDDGKYEFRIDPDDENSTVYVGDSPDDILAEVRKGVQEKDRVIRQVKLKENLAPGRQRRGLKEEDEDDEPKKPDIKLPDEGEITRKHYKAAMEKMAIDPEKIRHFEDDNWWDNYAEERGMRPWRVAEERQTIQRMIEQTNQAIETEIQDQTALYRNNETIDKVIVLASEALEDAKIPDSMVGKGKPFDFDAILGDALKKHVNKNGELDAAALTAMCNRAIRKIERESNGGVVKKKLQDDVQRAKEAAERIAGQGGSGAEHKRTPTAAGDYRTATKNFLKEHPV